MNEQETVGLMASSPALSVAANQNLGATQWGMLSFLASEAAFFATLIVAYLTLAGKDSIGPTPAEALSLPIVLCMTLVLVGSSVTLHAAEKKLQLGDERSFCRLWAVTIGLGLLFLVGTAYEWHTLITTHHLTISRNLFGTSYYTLVGFHGLHVTAGLVIMLIVLGLVIGRRLSGRDRTGVEMISWYWHFVDGVWLVVFTVVYLATR